jgi:protein tyrosine/serine phosphatase
MTQNRDVAPERWMTLAGADNVRDLGGLPRREGGATRLGVILRADALDGLTDDDVAALSASFGLRHVIDLRSAEERVERGRGRLGDGPVRYTDVEVIPDSVFESRRNARQQRFDAGDPTDVIMAEGYLQLLELGGSAFAQAIDALAADGGTPALFHCSAGKDRTGVFAALLLDVAGVEHEAIVADYTMTSERMEQVFVRLRGAESFARIADVIPAFVLAAEAATMERFLVGLGERWGNAAGYLRSVGAGVESIDRVRTLLT